MLTVDLGRRKQTGNSRTGHHRVDQSARGEPELRCPLDIGSDALEPNLEVVERDIAYLVGQPFAQRLAAVEMGAGAKDPARLDDRSPSYTLVSPDATEDHKFSRRSTERAGSWAMTAPLRAPTDVPTTRSGVIPCSKSALSIPTSVAPSTPRHRVRKRCRVESRAVSHPEPSAGCESARWPRYSTPCLG